MARKKRPSWGKARRESMPIPMGPVNRITMTSWQRGRKEEVGITKDPFHKGKKTGRRYVVIHRKGKTYKTYDNLTQSKAKEKVSKIKAAKFG